MLTLLTQNTNRNSYRAQQKNTRGPQNLLKHSLTVEELYRVNLATIREGVNHRRWPREVIERFLLAEA